LEEPSVTAKKRFLDSLRALGMTAWTASRVRAPVKASGGGFPSSDFASRPIHPVRLWVTSPMARTA